MVEVAEFAHHKKIRLQSKRPDQLYENAWKLELANSNFRQLFGIFAKDKKGNWIPNQIPNSIFDTRSFSKLKNRLPNLRITSENGAHFLLNYAEMDAETFIDFFMTVFTIRGEYGDSIKFRKIPSAWLDKNTEFDQLIGEVVNEEWQNDHFVGIEFSMNGFTTNKYKVKLFILNLWFRLGLFQYGDPIEQELLDTHGHIHWLLDIPSAPEEFREPLYWGLIGRWADSNVHGEITWLNYFRNQVQLWGDVRITIQDAKISSQRVQDAFAHLSIAALTGEEFGRLRATSKGILIANRSADLDLTVDPNFPPIFKRHLFGLRGIYGQTTVPEGEPVPFVGIEPRNDTIVANMESVPSQPALLLRHSSKEKRGLTGDKRTLKSILSENKIDPLVIDIAESLLFDPEDADPPAWSRPQVLAVAFLPLNDWLSNPRIRENLDHMTEPERDASLTRYHHALANYIRRLKQLTNARLNSSTRYQPEWITPLPNGLDGANCVFARSFKPHPDDSQANLTFVRILLTEAVRFIAEANLENLTQFD